MPTVSITLPHHRYAVRIEPGLLARLGELVREVAPHHHAALIVDQQIAPTHGRTATQALTAANYHTTTALMPIGEKHKTLHTVHTLYNVLLNNRLERKSPLIALGGGITGDTAGFVAATYLRGVPFIQAPTTLLAMVDASVGGKVGVNVPQGKNLIGAFHQPTLVAIDTDTLQTLPPRELRCGLAECVKHAVIRDESLFHWLQQNHHAIANLDSDTLTTLVERNVAIKAAVVMEDEKESGVRAHLNFGHTFAHAIEAATEYGTYHHGEAVSLGMIAATRLAVDRRLCHPSVLDRLVELLQAIGLPTSANDLPETDKLIDAMRLDKKVAAGRIRLILPTRLGEVAIIDDTPDSAIAAAWNTIRP